MPTRVDLAGLLAPEELGGVADAEALGGTAEAGRDFEGLAPNGGLNIADPWTAVSPSSFSSFDSHEGDRHGRQLVTDNPAGQGAPLGSLRVDFAPAINLAFDAELRWWERENVGRFPGTWITMRYALRFYSDGLTRWSEFPRDVPTAPSAWTALPWNPFPAIPGEGSPAVVDWSKVERMEFLWLAISAQPFGSDPAPHTEVDAIELRTSAGGNVVALGAVVED